MTTFEILWPKIKEEIEAPLLAEIERLRAGIEDIAADRDRWRAIADDMAQVFRDLAETQGLLPAYSATAAGTGAVGVHNAVRHICQEVLVAYVAAKTERR